MTSPATAASGGEAPLRVRVRVEGTVQGVGFRPYVYRIAVGLGLRGFVRNDGRGVVVEVEGPGDAVERFVEHLGPDAPPLAVVECLRVDPRPPRGEADFRILPSEPAELPTARVSPDVATCAACLSELLDPRDRRYRYPFLNCIDCGPRFTIVRGIPYDRSRTTMAGFTMCAACRAEYEDPADRRFHAQPNACAECGPRARLVDAGGAPRSADPHADPLAAAAEAVRGGAILALKGLGGFHLACRADDPTAVRTLRGRKHRADKPFAVMTRDLDSARRLVHLDAGEARLLEDRARPIVLARRRAGAPVADAVAPEYRDLGVMLPYSPLHHLLLADAGVPLVMTSGNVSDEPIAYRDDDALERLAAIADLFLLHDRPIETRTDDSVVRVVDVGGRRRPLTLRRSRGYVPAALPLPVAAARPLVACGAQQKNSVALASGARVWVGPHVGDLENYETLRAFRTGIDHLSHLCSVDPEVIVHDLHPEYLSSKYAAERVDLEPVGVQHHHAHLAACLAEHGEVGPAIGAVFDGTGYGPDGTIWGGELLLGDLSRFRRVGHLRPVRLPGGEAAVREPWRMACAWLAEVDGGIPDLPVSLRGAVDPERWSAVARLAASGVASPLTSSVGRLCDAVAALCGVRPRVSYEGQAAIELEMRADPRERESYALPGGAEAGVHVLDARAMVRAARDDLRRGVSVPRVAARFHNGLSDATARACAALAAEHGVGAVLLSGGVFQNVWLLERTAARLHAGGLRVLVPERLPPNDGGISYGQAVVAATGAHPARE